MSSNTLQKCTKIDRKIVNWRPARDDRINKGKKMEICRTNGIHSTRNNWIILYTFSMIWSRTQFGKYYDNAQSVLNRFHSLELNRMLNFLCACPQCFVRGFSVSLFHSVCISFGRRLSPTCYWISDKPGGERERKNCYTFFGNNLCTNYRIRTRHNKEHKTWRLCVCQYDNSLKNNEPVVNEYSHSLDITKWCAHLFCQQYHKYYTLYIGWMKFDERKHCMRIQQ